MKKNALVLLPLLVIGGIALVSCDTNHQDTSTSQLELIATCPDTMFVGDSDIVYFDVDGSDDDRATFTSSDSSVLTINDTGELTALKVGNATIKATSVAYPTLSQEFDVTVLGKKANSIELIIKTTSEDIIKVSDKIYNIPIGQEIILSYQLDLDTYQKPDSVSYSVNDQNGQLAGIVSLAQNKDEASLIVFDTVSNFTVNLNASYRDGIGQTITDSLVFSSYNKNESVFEKVNSTLDTLSEDGLISAKIDIYESKDNHIEYNQLSKDGITSVSDGTNYLYNIIDKNTNNHYLFKTDNNNIISEVLINESFDNDKLPEMENNALLYPKYVDGSVVYGHLNLIKYILDNTSYDSNLGFGYYLANSHAEVTFNNNQIILKSIFVDDNDLNIDMSFTINYNDDLKLIEYDYIFQEGETYYREHAYDLSYVDNDIEHTIDINDYYVLDYQINDIVGLVSPDGYYDYSDTNKFGYTDKQEIDGIVYYTVSYEKSLPLQVEIVSPSSASLLIDEISVTGVSSNGTRTFNVFNEGIVSISAPKEEYGDSLAVSETITFTSTKGISKKIIINFIKPDVTSVSLLDEGSANIQNNVFPDLFNNSTSGYFYLTSNPEDSSFTYEMKIISGNSQGISLYQWEKDNIFGYPNFSYSIKADMVGHYEFAFFVSGVPNILSQTYSIDVIEPYTTSYIKENIVGESYSYSTGTIDFTLTFDSDTSFSIIQKDNINQDVKVNVNYTISEGSIAVNGEQQTFADGFYFSHIKGGQIIFDSDFASISLSLVIRDEGSAYLSYQVYTFNKIIDSSSILDYVNGKTYTTSTFIVNYMMSNISLSFNNGNGTLILTNSNGEYARFTFTYTYQEGQYNDYFVFDNVNSTDGFSFVSNMMEYYKNSGELRIKVNTPNQYSSTTLIFSLL